MEYNSSSFKFTIISLKLLLPRSPIISVLALLLFRKIILLKKVIGNLIFQEPLWKGDGFVLLPTIFIFITSIYL